jgi:hypothetical protein
MLIPLPMKKLHLIAFVSFYWVSSSALSLQTAGWIEQARLGENDFSIKAKLDTGAVTSSVNALDMDFFTKDGKDHVRFKIKNKDDAVLEVVRPVVRYVSIKRHFTQAQKRPVVHLVICIGNVKKEAEVSLVDREKFDYPLLIGRSYLGGDFLIDSASTYRLQPACSDTKGR